ncbi:glycosyl transferase family 2 [Nocardioides albertanoniae]|uniref:Glycosyl transferase family 2 n=1 Tax=Nocardioides albertanoniae TaxID=1175486 RepID=A0A543A9X1_9ACTN|nr:glycosyltransferase family 2 protein [Nocardioides albertanoniae]TQL69402.1 glycosyl transferase family 2 [Nocardioides albertanoniae]
MRIIGTMMVRDEVDIVAAMIEHHLDQGVDTLIVTDNASLDGTAEVLERYAATGRVELHHDPVHQKQQGKVVTEMARRARTHFRADWVLNLDADEFLVPKDKGLTVRQALEATPLSLNAFTVDVENLVGPPAWSGGGLNRLHWRDRRPEATLEAAGLHAHPTPNAVHRGESDIKVVQGNHFVSLPSNGQPEAAVEMEVLHLPWRSWAQLERKVINAGKGYQANPELKPSPRHHGMRDYQRYLAGTLQDAYLARTPTRAELAAGAFSGDYALDEWLSNHLQIVLGRSLFPDLLRDVLDPETDKPVPDDEHARGAERGRTALAAEPYIPPRTR